MFVLSACLQMSALCVCVDSHFISILNLGDISQLFYSLTYDKHAVTRRYHSLNTHLHTHPYPHTIFSSTPLIWMSLKCLLSDLRSLSSKYTSCLAVYQLLLVCPGGILMGCNTATKQDLPCKKSCDKQQ